MKNASSILVVGGGPSGYELVGELAAAFPEKKITLVNSQGVYRYCMTVLYICTKQKAQDFSQPFFSAGYAQQEHQRTTT